jgi:predicted membrane protein
MILRTTAAVLAGLLAGAAAAAWAVSSISAGTATGAAFLAVLLMWAAGIAATAFGAGGVAFYGIGLVQLSWKSARRRG